MCLIARMISFSYFEQHNSKKKQNSKKLSIYIYMCHRKFNNKLYRLFSLTLFCYFMFHVFFLLLCEWKKKMFHQWQLPKILFYFVFFFFFLFFNLKIYQFHEIESNRQRIETLGAVTQSDICMLHIQNFTTKWFKLNVSVMSAGYGGLYDSQFRCFIAYTVSVCVCVCLCMCAFFISLFVALRLFYLYLMCVVVIHV